RIYGGAQEDVIFGATGDDQIWGGPDHDLLFGDHGMWDRARPVNERAISTYIDDNSGAGNDTIHGDEGDDFIWGQQGDDHLFGDDGEDDITGGHNVVGGSDGADTIDGGADADVVLGDNGQILRTLLTNRDNAWKRYPAPFADVIRQISRFDDEDRVGAGDTIEGGDGDDILHGQRGDDIMSGGAGDDEMIGELGNDTMSGGADNDILLGDVGQILRDFTPMGQPRVNENGSWHRDIVLEDVASVSGLINADMTPLQVNDPNLASKLMKSDLVIATGAHDANGNKIKNSANQAWDVDLLLVNLVAANNDTLDGGDGQDLVFGQRGNDIVAGGSGDDLVVGDNAVNLTPFDTELPHITRTIRLLEADNGVTVPFTFDARGNVISSPIELTPHEMSLNEPFWLTDTYANIASPTVDRMLDQVGAHELARTDGAKLTSLFTVIPDVLHHTDVLPGNDTVRGDAGDDLVVGDNAQFYSPLLTGFTPIDNATSDVQKYFQLLMYTMRSLGIDFEQLQAAQGASQVAHDIHVASDDVQGGTGNDRVLGDDGVFVIAPQLGLPVSEAELQRTATALLTYLQDLQTAATDMEHVAFEAHYQTLNTLLVTPGATAKPNLHDLYIGNDVIAGDEGNDTISGDQALLMMPVITGVRTELIRDNSHISTSVWDTVADSLLSADMLFRAKLNTHLSADHDKLNRTLNATQLAQLPPDYDYELFVGNDTIDAGDGNDLVLGDFAVDSIPISLTLPKTDIERFEQKQDVRELMDDMELFLERWHHPNDLSAWQSSYDHARFDERTGAAQEIAIHAGNDNINGGAGDDHVLADSDSLAVTIQVQAPQQRDTEVDPEWKVEFLNRTFFELTDHYSRNLNVSDLNEDTVLGGSGNDILMGQFNDDTLLGGPDDDKLLGGSGTNTTDGGAGTNDVRNGSEDTPSKEVLDLMKDRLFNSQEPWINELIRDIDGAPESTSHVYTLSALSGNLFEAEPAPAEVISSDVLANNVSGAWEVGRFTTAGLQVADWGQWATTTGWDYIMVGDFDGDGREDVIARNNGKWWVTREVNGQFVSTQWGN
ncbi:MAG: hypothetical protein KDA92_20210, partial [Planctomycetales bacterium]|nr:hypothetical protein [Planctomycetales bacterium]